MAKYLVIAVSFVFLLFSISGGAAAPALLDTTDPESVAQQEASVNGATSGVPNRLPRGKSPIKNPAFAPAFVHDTVTARWVHHASFSPSIRSKADVYQRTGVYRL